MLDRAPNILPGTFGHRTVGASVAALVERLNKKVKRPVDVVGASPDYTLIVCLVATVLIEQSDERETQHR